MFASFFTAIQTGVSTAFNFLFDAAVKVAAVLCAVISFFWTVVAPIAGVAGLIASLLMGSDELFEMSASLLVMYTCINKGHVFVPNFVRNSKTA